MMNVLAVVCLLHLTATIGKSQVDNFSNHNVIDATKNASGGIVTSPGFPGNYTQNAAYMWTIKTGNPKSVVHLNFTYIQIFEYQNQTQRCKDFLQVNRTEPCCKLALKCCGTLKPFSLPITGSEITISFGSNSVHIAKRFYLTWIVFIPETPTMSLKPLMSTKTSSTAATTSLITKTTTLATVSSTSKYPSETFAQTTRTTQKAWFLTTDTTQKILTVSVNDQNTTITSVYFIIGISVGELTLIAFGIYMYIVQRRQETH